MNKDHRSAGLRWSLPLRGGNFGGLLSSSFIFLMISCHIWSCGRWFCGSVYRDRWAMKRTSPLSAIMVFGDPYFSLGRSFLLRLELHVWGRKKERERESITWVNFPSFFWTVLGNGFPSLFDCSGGPHIITADVCLGLNGPVCVLGLIDGPTSLPLVFCHGKLLGFVCLGPSKQSLML